MLLPVEAIEVEHDRNGQIRVKVRIKGQPVDDTSWIRFNNMNHDFVKIAVDAKKRQASVWLKFVGKKRAHHLVVRDSFE